ncbi:MAG TPA: hypothetical protein VFI74_02290 [Candidatus Saccharimonadales bacterium]|nr:hypothetical protein [Candidatus Saccharimonadales bacterium]
MKADRAVYIGGFGNGKRSANKVADALTLFYDDVARFTFSWSMIQPGLMREIMERADVFTHSAGFMAIPDDARPNRVEAFSPPLETSRRHLLGRTLVKTARMHSADVIRSSRDAKAVAAYDLSSTAELAIRPIRNLVHLGSIACFDLPGRVTEMNQAGIPVDVTYTENDEYFTVSDHTLRTLNAFSQTSARRIPGVHDQLVLHPMDTLQAARVFDRM